MKNLAVLLILVSTSAFAAPWEAKVLCDAGRAVVDRAVQEGTGSERVIYQLVIRDEAAIAYLGTAVELAGYVNAKGEAIFPVIRIPASASYSGFETFVAYVGSRQVEATVQGESGLNVRVVEGQYYGRARTELLNWFFHPCEQR